MKYALLFYSLGAINELLWLTRHHNHDSWVKVVSTLLVTITWPITPITRIITMLFRRS